MQNIPKTISRREALKKMTVLGASTAVLPLMSFDANETFKIVIKNGKVFVDNQKLKETFVGITHEGTIKLSVSPIKGNTEIDATGKIVSPGFVDILADNAGSPKYTYRTFEKYKITDGLTTVLQMHGGAENPRGFHLHFDKVPHYVNYGVNTFVMKIIYGTNSVHMRYKKVEQTLLEGSLGVAHSIEYLPTPYAEVKEYAKLSAKYDRPLFLHLRYSSPEQELEGVKEAIQLAQETGARVHIDHLHSTGGTYNMEKGLEMIQNANDLGSEITCCVYPYSYWATYLISKRFDPGWRKHYNLDYNDLTIVGQGLKLNETTFNIYRRKAGVLVAVPEGTMPLNKTVDLALERDFCMIGSDGGLEREPRANNHPRGAGCFATTIRHCLNIGMSLEKTLSKVISIPARLMRPCLDNRAIIQDGKMADITIFDPQKIRGMASVANPNQFSAGIDTVIINGNIAYQNKKILGDFGKPIKYKSLTQGEEIKNITINK